MARRRNSPRYLKLLRVARATGKYPKDLDDPLWSQVPKRWYLGRLSEDPRDRGVTKLYKRH